MSDFTPVTRAEFERFQQEMREWRRPFERMEMAGGGFGGQVDRTQRNVLIDPAAIIQQFLQTPAGQQAIQQIIQQVAGGTTPAAANTGISPAPAADSPAVSSPPDAAPVAEVPTTSNSGQPPPPSQGGTPVSVQIPLTSGPKGSGTIPVNIGGNLVQLPYVDLDACVEGQLQSYRLIGFPIS